MDNFSGKKILFLGATPETIPLVKTAKECGLITYVADHVENSPAKVYADYPVLENCFEVEKMCEIVNTQKIDGVLIGCADILVPVYQQVCEITNKYCYVTKQQVDVFGNKKGLKNKLVEYGLPVIPEYKLDKSFFVEDLKNIIYPVFVKPVDNNSSKGMSICSNEEELRIAFAKALSFSRSQNVLVEKYMISDDFYVEYLFENGNIHVISIGDRYVTRQPGVGTITAAFIYPSKYADLYFATTHEKICKLFHGIKMSNGTLVLQGFIEDGKIMFYDPGLRINGGQDYFLIKHTNNFDLLRSLVNFSITGQMLSPEENVNLWQLNGNRASNLVFSVKTGKIGKIEGIEEAKLKKNVINVTQEHKTGDVISLYGTGQQILSRMHLVAGSLEELLDTIRLIQNNVKVYDESGNDILLPGFDLNKYYQESKDVFYGRKNFV